MRAFHAQVLCALFMGDARWVIGWAMVGRAEFAHLGHLGWIQNGGAGVVACGG